MTKVTRGCREDGSERRNKLLAGAAAAQWTLLLQSVSLQLYVHPTQQLARRESTISRGGNLHGSRAPLREHNGLSSPVYVHPRNRPRARKKSAARPDRAREKTTFLVSQRKKDEKKSDLETWKCRRREKHTQRHSERKNVSQKRREMQKRREEEERR